MPTIDPKQIETWRALVRSLHPVSAEGTMTVAELRERIAKGAPDLLMAVTGLLNEREDLLVPIRPWRPSSASCARSWWATW